MTGACDYQTRVILVRVILAHVCCVTRPMNLLAHSKVSYIVTASRRKTALEKNEGAKNGGAINVGAKRNVF